MGCCIGDCCVVDCGFCCVFDCCVFDSGCSYNPRHDDGTVETTVKTSNDLADLRERANEEGQKIGQEAFNNINVYMQQLIDHLENINNGVYGGKKLNIDIQAVHRDMEELKNMVKNYIGDKMNERFVKTDPELSLIFDEVDDRKRAQSFNAFYTKVQKDALRSLINDIQDIFGKEFAMVDKQIRARLEEVNDSMAETKKEYEKAAVLLAKKDGELAKNRVGYMYQLAITDLFKDELNNFTEKSKSE